MPVLIHETPEQLATEFGGTADDWKAIRSQLDDDTHENDETVDSARVREWWVTDATAEGPLRAGATVPRRVFEALTKYYPARIMVALLRASLPVLALVMWSCTTAEGADEPPCGGTTAPITLETTLTGTPCVLDVQDSPTESHIEINPQCTPPGYTAIGLVGGTIADAVVYVVLP